MSINLISKITIKTVYGNIDVEKLINAPGKQLELMDVYGICRKATPGTSEYGEYMKFRGSFRATNLDTGESFQSGAVILPRVAEEALAGAITDDTNEIQFGFRVVVRYDASAVTKYVYSVIPLLAPAENDPVTLLENQIAENFKALAAPVELKAEKAEKGGKK
jgi:hypothetical protein